MLHRRIFAFELLTYISDESMPEPGRSGTDLRPVAEGRRDIDCSALLTRRGWLGRNGVRLSYPTSQPTGSRTRKHEKRSIELGRQDGRKSKIRTFAIQYWSTVRSRDMVVGSGIEWEYIHSWKTPRRLILRGLQFRRWPYLRVSESAWRRNITYSVRTYRMHI